MSMVPVGLAHVALDRPDGPVGVGDGLALGDLADEDLVGLGEADDGRRGARPLGVGDNGRLARLEDADDRVGGAEVDADGLGHEIASVVCVVKVVANDIQCSKVERLTQESYTARPLESSGAAGRLRAVGTLVLLRHGQSQWNLENRFTGWWDVDLSAQGEKEARSAGALIAEAGIGVDVAHTSVLTRAIRTLDLALEEMGRLWVPVRRHWRLNERHYGALTGPGQGRDQGRATATDQFLAWRRSYDTPPPPMPPDHPLDVRGDPRYAGLAPDVRAGHRVPGRRGRPAAALLA